MGSPENEVGHGPYETLHQVKASDFYILKVG